MEDRNDNLEHKTKKNYRHLLKTAGLFIGLPAIGLVVAIYLYSQEKKEYTSAELNISPNAVKIERLDKFCSSWSYNNYEDVNGDGFFEHTAEIINPKTGEREKRLVEFYGDQIRLRLYKVDKGNIIYLDQ